jgi:hypothetical protein
LLRTDTAAREANFARQNRRPGADNGLSYDLLNLRISRRRNDAVTHFGLTVLEQRRLQPANFFQKVFRDSLIAHG